MSETDKQAGEPGEPLLGQRPTPEDKDWLEYYREAKREGFRNANDTAKIILATNSALITAYLSILSVAKAKDRLIITELRDIVLLVPLVFFLASSFLSIKATMVRIHKVDPYSPSDIEGFHKLSIRQKHHLTQWAFACLAAGSLSVVVKYFFVM